MERQILKCKAGGIQKFDMNPKQFLTEYKNNNLSNRLLAQLLDKPEDFSQKWLINRKWMAVPIPDRITEIDAPKIVDSVTKHFQNEKIVAISTDIGTNDIFEFKEFSIKTLLEFDRYYSLHNFVILSSNISFCILKEAGLYVIIAGPPAFVEDATYLPVSSMMAEFWEYAKDGFSIESIRRYLIVLANKYEQINNQFLHVD